VIAVTERSDASDWPDPEILIRACVLDLASVGTEVPADPDGTYSWLPFVRVQCIGGRETDPATDTFRMSVDAFAASKADAAQLAGAIRQRLLNGPIVTDNGILDYATTSTRPMQVPYGDVTRVIRYTAAYSGQMRRR
jgi:hypothetical protein